MLTNLEIALIGGITGALLTAILSFVVQNELAKRRRKEDERRMAYVCLVKVSDIVSMEMLIKRLSNVYISVYRDGLEGPIQELKEKRS